MANQVTVSNNNTINVTVEPPANVQVQVSRAVIGTVANVASANLANYVIQNSQPNITSVGTLTGLTSSGNIIAPFFIGNVVGNISGNFVVPGTNTAILFNQSGNAGASDALKFDYAANILTANGNIVANYYSGNGSQLTGVIAVSANYANFANVSNIANSVAVANVSGIGNIATINLDGNAGNILYGNGIFAASPNVANIANANYANFAGDVVNSSQPNITSLGTLTGLVVGGDITPNSNVTHSLGNNTNRFNDLYLAGNTIYLGAQEISADANGISFTGNLSGNATGLSNIPGANVTGQVPYAAIANSVAGANVNGQVNYAAVANSVSGANVSGTVANATYATNAGSSASANSVAGANVSGQVGFAAVANSVAGANVGGQVANALVSGTVYTNAQPNITSVGTLTSLAVTGNITSFANITGDYFLGNGALLTGVGNFSAALGYHGSFFSNVTQTAASTTTAYPITLNNTSPGTYGVSVASNSRVTFTYAGIYNIQYSIQFTNSDSAVHNATVWLRKNGTDVPDTNSVFAVTAKHGSINGQLIGAINYIEDVNANDYYELIWQAESTDVSLEYIPPGTTPTSPASPSIIVTAMQVTNVQAATLSGNLTGDLIGNTYGLTGTSFVNIIGNISGNVFTGNGSGLTNLNGANVTGQVANALVAGTVYTNAQPNITSVGNLPYLQVSNSANATGVINQLASNNITFATNSTNVGTYQLTTEYHPNNSVGYPADRTIRSRGNVTTPATASSGDRIYQKSLHIFNGNTNPLAVSEVFTAVNINANTTAVWTGGQWNMTTGNPTGDTANQGNNSWQNQLIFTNSGSLQINPGNVPNTSLGQSSSSLLITNYGLNTTDLAAAGGVNQQKARGNRDALLSVEPGDTVGRQNFWGYNGTIYQSARPASVFAEVDSAYVANATIIPLNITITTISNSNTNVNTTFYGNGLAQFPGDITTTATANVGNLNVTGLTDLGNVGNLTITGGTANYVLSTDGAGNLDWVAQTGGGNTGNVTFDDVTVQGVNGLNLSADPTFTANLAYLRVRSGDVASHIHFDTGNNNAYDLIVGDDAKFVQVSSTGNILMSSYDGNASYAWNMDNTGNLILPGNTFAVNYANGTQVSIGGGTPGGNTTELQYNNSGNFAGMANVTFDGSNISLGDISTVKIAGGTANDFIQTDGAGNLSFAGIATNLIVGTRISPVTILISNYQMNVLARTGNVVVYVN